MVPVTIIRYGCDNSAVHVEPAKPFSAANAQACLAFSTSAQSQRSTRCSLRRREAPEPPAAYLLVRGWTEQEPSICAGTGYPVPVFQIPIPAEPVQDIWQEKSRKIGNSLKWFQRVTFTFWIKMHRKKNFLLIFLTVVTGMPVLPEAQRQKQDIPSSHKYLVSFLFNPYHQGIKLGCVEIKCHHSVMWKSFLLWTPKAWFMWAVELLKGDHS